MKNNKNFNKQINQNGRPTELMVKAYLSYLGYNIVDCENDMQKQKQGYDLIADGTVVQVKKDWKISQTGNFFGEWATERKGYTERGWMQHSKAEWLIYFDGVDTIHFLDMQKFIEYLTENENMRRFTNKGDSTNTYTIYVWGYLLKKEKAEQLGIWKKSVKLSDEFINVYKQAQAKAKEKANAE